VTKINGRTVFHRNIIIHGKYDEGLSKKRRSLTLKGAYRKKGFLK